jgi:hypothetical protein
LNPRGRAQNTPQHAQIRKGATPLNPRGRAEYHPGARPKFARAKAIGLRWGLSGTLFRLPTSGISTLCRPDFGSELQWLRYATYAARGPDSATMSPGPRRRPTGAGTRTSNGYAQPCPAARSGSTSALRASRLARSPADLTPTPRLGRRAPRLGRRACSASQAWMTTGMIIGRRRCVSLTHLPSCRLITC